MNLNKYGIWVGDVGIAIKEAPNGGVRILIFLVGEKLILTIRLGNYSTSNPRGRYLLKNCIYPDDQVCETTIPFVRLQNILKSLFPQAAHGYHLQSEMER